MAALTGDLDSFVAAYEEARDAGAGPGLAPYLPPAEHPLHLEVLRELARVELEWEWRAGQRPTLEAYRDYPRLFADAESLRQVAFEEYRLRLAAGERPSAAEYAERYGVDTTGWPTSAPRQRSVTAGHGAAGPSDDVHGSAWQALSVEDPASARRLAQATAAFPESGQRLAGFRVVSELGRGALGRAYLAMQESLADRLVVLKVAPDLGHGEDQILARLQHTNIVPIHSVHRVGPLVVICMPFFGATTLGGVLRGVRSRGTLPTRGQSLVDTLRESRPIEASARSSAGPLSILLPDSQPSLPASDTSLPAPHSSLPTPHSSLPTHSPLPAPQAAPASLRWLQQSSYSDAVLWIGARIAEGLAHAHDRGVVHGDLKPANVLLADDGQPMLLDFNLAREATPSAAIVQLGGTLPYMAPECLDGLIARRAVVDPRSDLFSLGVLLYELLTGELPYGRASFEVPELLPAMAVERRQLPAGLPSLAHRASPAVAAIVARCLAADPERRYQSAREVAEDLERQLAHRPLRHAPDRSPVERCRKLVRRHPRLVGVVAGALGVGLCALALALALLSPWERSRARAAWADLRNIAAELPGQLATPDVAPEARAEGLALCRRVADEYGVLRRDDWLDSSLVRRLDDVEQSQLRRTMGTVLWLWARGERWQLTANPDQERLAEARRVADEASRCYDAGRAPAPLCRLRAELAELAGDAEEAARQRTAAEVAPSDASALLLACELIGEGRHAEALPLLRDVSRDEPSATTWLLLGHCFAATRQFPLASQCFELAGSLQPQSPWPPFYLGLACLEAGDHAGAEEAFTRVLEIRPLWSEALTNRALARLAADKSAEAVDDLTLALEQPDPSPRLWLIRSRALAATGDVAGAELDRQEGLRHTPVDEPGWIARGLARLPGDPEGALRDFDEALRVAPRSRLALRNKAAVLSEILKRPAEALVLLGQALEISADDLPVRAGRAVLLARSGRREQAVSDARSVLAAGPDATLVYQAACVFALIGAPDSDDHAEALRLLARAIAAEPHWSRIAPSDPDLASLHRDPRFLALVR